MFLQKKSSTSNYFNISNIYEHVMVYLLTINQTFQYMREQFSYTACIRRTNNFIAVCAENATSSGQLHVSHGHLILNLKNKFNFYHQSILCAIQFLDKKQREKHFSRLQYSIFCLSGISHNVNNSQIHITVNNHMAVKYQNVTPKLSNKLKLHPVILKPNRYNRSHD